MMEAVYVMEPGSWIRRQGAALCIYKDRELVEKVPAEGLKRLVLVGRINLTAPVLDFLISRRVETVFMTPAGRFRARLGIDEHRHVALRKAQYAMLGDDGFALATARIIVAAKTRNMARLLTVRGRAYGSDPLRAAAAGLQAFANRAGEAAAMPQLRGIEGAAAGVYFRAFGHLIRNDRFSFGGRTRRPPLDPVNALLSFVYTMLTNEVLSAIKARGLDPYMGALHEIDYGRPSLACDLVEEYRAFLGDRLVLGLINRQAVAPEDFIYRDNRQTAFRDEAEMKARRPVEMRPGARKALIAGYEAMMQRAVGGGEGYGGTYRGVMLRQVGLFADYLENPGTHYVPFSWRT